MTNSVPGKRERLIDAAVRVFYERGVEKTTIADIARVADVPVGNVYYYFKTKDQLIEAAIGAHARGLDQLTAELNRLEDPRERLRELVSGWVAERELAARFGCPFGSLTAELHKRDDPLEGRASEVMQRLVDWSRTQFEELGRADAQRLAIALISSYQGISMLTNAFRDPELMVAEGERLREWIDSL
ncbi:TetR/AcrR family transcriptional regulator [Nocardia sp. NPDC127579]|uniref:TetR/AcrR family transcriptional regulator n=1 Tax=Nocardia sp. NPDC127579 TaxID=3345402 RepID=UPI0036333152